MAASILLLQACATSSSIEEARWQYFAGQPNLALKTLESGETSSRDQLLKYLEAGMIAHSAGLYEQSSKELIRAAALVDEYETVRLGEQSAALVTNDWLLSYKGEYSERLWIHTIQMMNFLLMDDPEGAAVEARQALEQLDIHKESLERDWFTRALIATSFEAAGKFDSAHIEYRKLFDVLGYDLGWASAAIDNATRLGRTDDNKKFKDQLKGSNQRMRLHSVKQNASLGELILFVESGIIQTKVAGNIFILPDMRASFPIYPDYDLDPIEISARVGGTPLGIDSIDTTLVNVARKSLSERAGSLTTRQIARIAVKHQIGELAEDEDELLGALVKAILFITEEADTRSWQTLPQQLAMVRIPLTEGVHNNLTVTVTDGFKQHQVRLPSVNIREGKRTFRRVRVGRGALPEVPDSEIPPDDITAS